MDTLEEKDIITRLDSYKAIVCLNTIIPLHNEAKVNPIGTWFRCLVKIIHQGPQGSERFRWYEMSFFTYWEPGHCVVLCIDTPDTLATELERTLSRDSNRFNLIDPFSLHIPLMDQIIKLYDKSVWGIRDLIRGIEKVIW